MFYFSKDDTNNSCFIHPVNMSKKNFLVSQISGIRNNELTRRLD